MLVVNPLQLKPSSRIDMFLAQAVLNAILFKDILRGNKKIVYMVTGLLP